MNFYLFRNIMQMNWLQIMQMNWLQSVRDTKMSPLVLNTSSLGSDIQRMYLRLSWVMWKNRWESTVQISVIIIVGVFFESIYYANYIFKFQTKLLKPQK